MRQTALFETANRPEWRRARRYAGAVTLDPDTAHRMLILSEDGRSVRRGDRAQDLPDTPERFDRIINVLGRERLSSGRHYWEVEVGDKTRWDLGVCDESVSRKGAFTGSPEDGYWAVRLRDGEYKAATSPSTPLTPSVPPRVVGLFLDYGAGRFSVYNVTDRSQLFTFSGAPFPRTLRPFFCPGRSDVERSAAGPASDVRMTVSKAIMQYLKDQYKHFCCAAKPQRCSDQLALQYFASGF